MNHFDALIETMEILHRAIQSKDGEKGYEAVTILMMQITDIYGFGSDMFDIMFPFLEELKERIESGDYEDANLRATAMLAKFREAREVTA